MTDTLMWEVRAEPGKRGELLRWVEEIALPTLSGYRSLDVYLGGPDRIVVIGRWDGEAGRLPEPPADLLARPAAQWPFRHHRTVTEP